MTFNIKTIPLLFVCLWACSDPYHKSVTVAKVASISTPDELLDTTDCRQLWETIANYAMKMDELSEEWNDIVMDSVYELIEKRCVKEKAEQ